MIDPSWRFRPTIDNIHDDASQNEVILKREFEQKGSVEKTPSDTRAVFIISEQDIVDEVNENVTGD